MSVSITIFVYWQLVKFSTLSVKAGLQITVGHRTISDQNLPMSDYNCNLGRTFCPANFLLHHLTISFTDIIWLSFSLSFECTFVFMSDQIFLSSDQNGALVGHMSFQGKKGTVHFWQNPYRIVNFTAYITGIPFSCVCNVNTQMPAFVLQVLSFVSRSSFSIDHKFLLLWHTF